jgi:hypothetical protein
MNQDIREIYVTTINIPEEFIWAKGFSMFVEIKAELKYWKNEEPAFTVQINNLDLTETVAIKWFEFEPTIINLVTEHFKTVYNKI